MASRSERQAASDGGQSFGHAAQAGSLRCLLSVFGVGGLAGFACGRAGQAAAVVGDLQRQLAVVLDQAYPAGSRAGMPDHVGHGLTLRSGTFDPDAEAVLAWCLREAVTNVIRHSRAGHCRIRLTDHPGELSLEVTDDGRGLVGQDPKQLKGSGLRGMSERLSAIGGRLSVGWAEPGRGLRLTATVPASAVVSMPESGHNCQL